MSWLRDEFGGFQEENEPGEARPRGPSPGKVSLTSKLPPRPGHEPAVQAKAASGAAISASPAQPREPLVTRQPADDGYVEALHFGSPEPVAVQMRSASGTASADDEKQAHEVHQASADGLRGSAQHLPHLDRIQQSFGRHEVGHIEAHVGGPAVDATKRMGAVAYASGSQVAFAAQPDLHTAAHEAAHVVQQASGVRLANGVGAVGDTYEQHADAVADAVVAGHSAETLLDGMAPGSRPSPGGPAAATQRAVVQRATKSDYKDDTAISAMTLREFDQHAHDQADWASSTALTGGNRDKMRMLLEFARKSDGLVLGACGDFKVSDLVVWGVGTGGPVDENLGHYSRAASVNKAAPTVNIEAPAATLDDASKWGEALGKLQKAPGLGGLIIQKVIKQDSSRNNLESLVNDGAVDDFIAYVKLVKPNLDADNGREIISYLAFRAEGCDPATYKSQLPTIRNLHRFSKADLDGVITNQKAPKGDLPLTIIIQSGFDHNGAFHRDPNLTSVITRPNNVTLVLEGENSLAGFSSQLQPLATKYKNDGKIDQVMINGHGNAKLMEAGGENGTGTNSSGDTVYGRTKNEPLTVDQNHPKPYRDKTDAFFTELINAMKDDPASRIVLNACLTASNSVDTPLRTDTPDHTQEDIRNAIAANPSLATALARKAADLGKGNIDVRGSNASFGQIGLLDGGQKIDLISGSDPKLTAPKLEYAKEGTDPTGALRAATEAWGTNRKDAIDAINWRIANRTGLDWKEVAIRSLYKVIVTQPDNGELINQFTTAASALAHLPSKSECTVAGLVGKVPSAHMDAIFTELETATVWPMADFQYLPAVVYQVWMAQNSAKKAKFIQHLTGSTLTTQSAASCIDLGHVTSLLDNVLLPTPAPKPAPRGPTLLALLFLVKQGKGAPAACKQYLVSVADGGQSFPLTANVAGILKGASEREVLEDAGIVQASPSVTKPVVSSGSTGPEPNLAPKHESDNQLIVESVTLRGTTKSNVDALDTPGGTKQGTIAKGTALHIIGKAKGTKKRFLIPDVPNTEYFAIEHSLNGFFTVFVEASSITVIT